MSTLHHGFDLIVGVIFLAILAFVVSKVQPEADRLITTPSRIEAINAENSARVKLAQRSAELELEAKRQAIENSKIEAQARANAEAIKAQGSADAARKSSEAIYDGVILVGILAGSAVILWFVTRIFRIHRETAFSYDPTIALPDGQRKLLPSQKPWHDRSDDIYTEAESGINNTGVQVLPVEQRSGRW